MISLLFNIKKLKCPSWIFEAKLCITLKCSDKNGLQNDTKMFAKCIYLYLNVTTSHLFMFTQHYEPLSFQSSKGQSNCRIETSWKSAFLRYTTIKLKKFSLVRKIEA